MSVEELTQRRSDEEAAAGSARVGARRDSRWTHGGAGCGPPSRAWAERREPGGVGPAAQEREAPAAVSTADLVSGLRASNGASGGGRASHAGGAGDEPADNASDEPPRARRADGTGRDHRGRRGRNRPRDPTHRKWADRLSALPVPGPPAPGRHLRRQGRRKRPTESDPRSARPDRRRAGLVAGRQATRLPAMHHGRRALHDLEHQRRSDRRPAAYTPRREEMR